MQSFRIGKTLKIKWTILSGGAPEPLTGRDLTLEISSGNRVRTTLPFVPEWLALTASVVAVSATGVGKEMTDDKADLRDLAATLGGGVVVWLPFLIAILIV